MTPRYSSFEIKNPTLQNIDKNVAFFEKNRVALLRYILSGLPHPRKKVRYLVLGRHVNQFAAAVGLLPVINGQECYLPAQDFCNLGEVENIRELISDFIFLYCVFQYRNKKIEIRRSMWCGNVNPE